MDRRSSGIYRCIADNGVRDPVSFDMQLSVLSEYRIEKNKFFSAYVSHKIFIFHSLGPPELETERPWVHAGEGKGKKIIKEIF